MSFTATSLRALWVAQEPDKADRSVAHHGEGTMRYINEVLLVNYTGVLIVARCCGGVIQMNTVRRADSGPAPGDGRTGSRLRSCRSVAKRHVLNPLDPDVFVR